MTQKQIEILSNPLINILQDYFGNEKNEEDYYKWLVNLDRIESPGKE